MKHFFHIFLVISLMGSFVYASDLKSAIVEYDGVTGFWFPEETATEMLKDLEEFSLLRKKTSELELKMKGLEELILYLREDIKITEKISEKWKVSFDSQVSLTTLERQQRDKWYRAPVFWFAVGFAAASLAAVGLTYGLKEARD